MSDFDLEHLDMDEEEGYEATGEDDDDPAVEDGNVLHDRQICQGEVRPICGDASKVCQVVDLKVLFCKNKKDELPKIMLMFGESLRFQVLHLQIYIMKYIGVLRDTARAPKPTS